MRNHLGRVGHCPYNQSHGSKAADTRIFNVGVVRTPPFQLPIIGQNHFGPILHAEPTPSAQFLVGSAYPTWLAFSA